MKVLLLIKKLKLYLLNNLIILLRKVFFKEKIFLSFFYLLLFFHSSFSNSQERLNIYNWSGYLDPNIISDFEKETGIKVNYDVYDSNYLLESKLLVTTNSGYDIVVPSVSPFLIRQIEFGLYQKLDISKLKNYPNLDPNILKMTGKISKVNDYSVPYSWNGTVIAYNKEMIDKIIPNQKWDSWGMIFDPKIVKKLASCGVELSDTPMEIIAMMLAFHNKEPYGNNFEDLEFASKKLAKIRPYIKSINNSSYMNNLANGETCVAIGFSGDIAQARNSAKEANNNINIKILYPKEANEVGIDAMAILHNAPNTDNAYKFIDFILRPENSAKITNYTFYPTINIASRAFILPEILLDEDIVLDMNQVKNIYISDLPSSKYEKARTRIWLKFISAKN